jgi:Restriction endonuclease
MPTAQEKGEALEAAVVAIEQHILQTSPASFARPLIKRRKIIQIGGVHHEIDLHVTIPSASGYESTYIFECKNWQEAVNKNEIIVFSEKIDAAKASLGYFVAKAFTADAEAQAKKDPRLILLKATEHDPKEVPVPVELFGRFPSLTKVKVIISPRGSKGLNQNSIRVENARATYLGKNIDLLPQVDAWTKEACDGEVATFNSTIAPEGVFEKVLDCELRFPSGDLIINEQDIDKISLHIEYKITVEKSKMVSHFEVESRGRCFRFAPLTTGGAAIEGYLIFSGPAASP